MESSRLTIKSRDFSELLTKARSTEATEKVFQLKTEQGPNLSKDRSSEGNN